VEQIRAVEKNLKDQLELREQNALQDEFLRSQEHVALLQRQLSASKTHSSSSINTLPTPTNNPSNTFPSLVSGLNNTASLPTSIVQPSSTYSLTSSIVNMSTLLGVGAEISSVANRSAAAVLNKRSLAYTSNNKTSDLLSCFFDRHMWNCLLKPLVSL